MSQIRIALVDDHVLTRKGIKSIIEINPDMAVILEAGNGIELFDQLSLIDVVPDFVILDLSMPKMNGIETIDELQLKYPSIKIIVFSLFRETDTVLNVLGRGVSGYIHKSAAPEILLQAIKKNITDDYFISDLVKKDFPLNRIPAKKKKGFHGQIYLSSLELQFVKLAADDLTLQEIADKMNKTRSTMENYRDSLFTKLNISNRAALVSYAYKNGLIEI